MRDTPPLGTMGWIGVAVVLLLASVTRIGYLTACCDAGAAAPRFLVQGDGPRPDFAPGVTLRDRDRPTEFDNLVHNLREHRWFGSLAPLADREESTGHVSPGYYWLASYFSSDTDLRRAQTALSIVAAVWVLWANRQDVAQSLANSLRWETAVLAGLVLLVVTLLHELAHGLTCKHYGGEVREIGFLLLFFMPCFYCNVSDAWLLARLNASK